MSPSNAPLLVADIGATYARFALVERGGGPGESERLACADFPDIATAIRHFLDRHASASGLRVAALAVAAPVTGDRVEMTNHPWRFSVEGLRRALGIERLEVINDFAAIALSLPHLSETQLRKVGGGAPEPEAAKVVLGPGSGLGAAALVRAAGTWRAIAGEGGHVDFAPANEREVEILNHLRAQWPHVSLERVLSGPGLVNLYRAVRALDGTAGEAENGEPEPAEIVERAAAGTSRAGSTAVHLFSAILGGAAGNIALILGARGGVYVAGGIVPSMGAAFDAQAFRRRFEEKGRFASYLAEIPTYLILTPDPALIGLARMMDVPDGG